MNEIKLPLKSEGRSRAKILTEEAFRETRNYIKVQNNKTNEDAFTHLAKRFAKKSNNERNQGDIQAKTLELREILNKITTENFDFYQSTILKYDYNDELMDNFKNIIYLKVITEKKYFNLYLKLCLEMFKLYNRKTHPNNPDMNFQSMLLKRCKEEFYSPDDSNIVFPFIENDEEKQIRLVESKYGNIKLISELYMNGVVPIKVINECIEFLKLKTTDFYVRSLCQMIKIIYEKLLIDDSKSADTIMNQLEDLYSKKEISTKTKFFILDCIDLKLKSNSNTKKDDYLYRKEDLYNCQHISSARKSSIGSNIDLIRRSRFNSKADEYKSKKISNQDTMNELVDYLGSDIQFYQCFKLNEEQHKIVFNKNKILIDFWNKTIHRSNLSREFMSMVTDLSCEKFIAVGHILDIMFSMNSENANSMQDYLVFLFNDKTIDSEDIKHGIVLGLVNFRDNIINFPCSNEYLKKFLVRISDLSIVDKNLLDVYEKCCDNIERFII